MDFDAMRPDPGDRRPNRGRREGWSGPGDDESKSGWWRWLIVAGVAAGAVLAVWQFVYQPREAVRQYNDAYQEYLAGNAEAAAVGLRRARELDPDLDGVSMLLGWSYWRLGQNAQAERHFEEAYERNPDSFDAQNALGMVRLALDEPESAIAPLEAALASRPGSDEVRQRLADAYQRTGRNLDAAEIFRRMLEEDPANIQAETALLEIFGRPNMNSFGSFALPPRVRPDETEVPYRAQGDYIQVRRADDWEDVYLTGVNLGPGRPGEFAVTSSLEFEVYREWLTEIEAMNGNTVRTYTILPPAFYQALLAHNEDADEPLWLIQEVWLDEEVMDLYDPAEKAIFERELRDAIDVIHGQADIACRTGHYCGIYGADVSEWVIGIGVGREVEPRVVRHTNRMNPERTSYSGTYVSLDEGNPSEAWFAEMCDQAAAYEMDTYNAQRPLTVVTWPPLDPMSHPTEATYEEEMAIRRELGEELVPDTVSLDMNDLDAVSVDIMLFETGDSFTAGLFALYHVYQHWPDFLFLQESYTSASDDQGPNRYLGYLLELKEAHEGMPLLIGEYGLASSMIPAHIHPDGWHNGGLTEEEQAELLERFTRNIRNTRMAGGIVFSWLDEWWKQVHDRFTQPMEIRATDDLWHNRLDPEEHFGVVGFRPFERVPLLRGSEADWEGATLLYGGSRDAASTSPGGDQEADGSQAAGGPQTPDGSQPRLAAVYADSDYNYFYLRVDLEGAELDWDESRIWIALNTLPEESGSRLLPAADLRIASGANFVVRLEGPTDGRLLISENYNPWEEWPLPGRPELVRILTRYGMSVEPGEAGFEEVIIEANSPRWARDGREFPSVYFDRSQLTHGTADPEAPGYTSHATWRYDADARMVEIRLPWALILFMDPSRRLAFGGTDDTRTPVPTPSPGITVSAFLFDAAPPTGEGENGLGPLTVRSSFPSVREGLAGVRSTTVEGPVARYEWDGWTRVRYEPYFKPAYFTLQELWGSWPRTLNAPTASAAPAP